MCEIPLSYNFMCAICGIRWSGFYVYGDPLPETSICPECEKKFKKLDLSWEPKNENMVECKSI